MGTGKSNTKPEPLFQENLTAYELAPQNLKYEKSNVLVNSFYSMTTSCRKVVNYTLTYFRGLKIDKEDMERGLKKTFSAVELKKDIFPNMTRTAIYTELDKVANALTSSSIAIKDPESRYFKYINFISSAEYKDGKFTIRFSPDISPYIANLGKNEEIEPEYIETTKKGFTVFEYNANRALETTYGIAIYEILKSQLFKLKNGHYSFEIPLFDLKCQLGCINVGDEKVRSILNSKADNDSKLESINQIDEGLSLKLQKQKKQVHKYKTWGEFERSVLSKGKEDFDQAFEKGALDFNFTYKAKKGSHQKVTDVRFDIYSAEKWSGSQKEPINEKLYSITELCSKMTELGYPDFIKSVEKFPSVRSIDMTPIDKMFALQSINILTINLFGVGLQDATLQTLWKLSDENIDIIFQNIKYIYKEYTEKGKPIKDLQKLLATAVRDDYSSAIPAPVEEKKEKRNKFNNFEQRTYNFDELEKEAYNSH